VQILAGIMVPLLGDLLENLAPVIFLLLYGIYQLVMGKAEANKKDPRPRRPKRPQLAEAPDRAAPVDAPPNQADALRNEVEEFLRRAQGKPPKEEVVPLKPVAPSRQRPPKRLAAQQRKPLTPRLAKQRQPVQAKPTLRREGVAEHVSRHVGSTQIAEHAERLGDEVGLADDRMDSRLQEKFGHRLGSAGLQAKELVIAPKKADLASEIAKLLRSPEGMRQLIVAQEILRRPDRW